MDLGRLRGCSAESRVCVAAAEAAVNCLWGGTGLTGDAEGPIKIVAAGRRQMERTASPFHTPPVPQLPPLPQLPSSSPF